MSTVPVSAWTAQPAASLTSAAAPGLSAISVRWVATSVGYALFALFIFFTCFTFLRPSPYDFAAIPTVLLWPALGIRIHRSVLVILVLLLAYVVSLLIALMPHLDEALSVEWTYQFVYLMVTAVFFIGFFSDDTLLRVRLGLRAYLASCLFAAICGILSYFDALGGRRFLQDGRPGDRCL